MRMYYIFQRHASSDKIITKSHRGRGKINLYATLGKNKFPQTSLDVSTSFSTSDRSTYHKIVREKINFPHKHKADS